MQLVYSPTTDYQFYVPSRLTLTQHEVKETVTPSKGDSVIIFNDERHIQQATMALPEDCKLEFVKETVACGGSIYNIV